MLNIVELWMKFLYFFIQKHRQILTSIGSTGVIIERATFFSPEPFFEPEVEVAAEFEDEGSPKQRRITASKLFDTWKAL